MRLKEQVTVLGCSESLRGGLDPFRAGREFICKEYIVFLKLITEITFQVQS